jgi:hypothetical protein
MSNRSRSKGYNTNAVKVDKTSNVSSQDQFYGNQKSYNTTSAAIPTSNQKKMTKKFVKNVKDTKE